jgi:hypothetical protein
LLVLAVFVYTLFKAGTQGSTILPTVPESLELEEAIACSYYRCTEGCASPQVRDTVILNCRTEFCKPQFTDSGTADGKVCGDNSKNHPVKVTIPSSSYLSQVVILSSLSQLTGGKIKYMAESGDKCSDPGIGTNTALFDKQKVMGTESKSFWDCQAYETVVGGSNYCVSKIEIYADSDYYVSTYPHGLGGYNTIVCSEGSEGTVSIPGCGDAGGVCRPENCLANEEQIQGTCPQGRDITKVCCKSKD